MAETIMGLVFLSTAFILSHLMGDIDRYHGQVKELQSKYIYTNPENVSDTQLITDYQKYRTIRIGLGNIMIETFGIFAVGILALWTWFWSFVYEDTLHSLFAVIVLLLIIFVIIFQVSEFIICSGHEGVERIINNLATMNVLGQKMNFKEYARQRMVKCSGLSREQIDARFELNIIAKLMLHITNSWATKISIIIIIMEFLLMILIVLFYQNLIF